MNIIVKESYQEMSVYAAHIIAELVRNKGDCVLGLATGSTPIGTYRELIRLHREEGLDFSRVRTFNLDEYLGIGKDLSRPYAEDQSYGRFMFEELFRHINIREENIRVPDGRSRDPEAFCRGYEEDIRKAGGIDLQLLGIGGDGHWGFNEPGSTLASRTRVEKLTQQTLDDNYEAFYRNAGIPRSQMPDRAITMGIATILDAKSLVMLASGKKKAGIVARALEGPISTDVTASAIQAYTGPATVVLEAEAASALKRI